MDGENERAGRGPTFLGAGNRTVVALKKAKKEITGLIVYQVHKNIIKGK